MIDALRTKSILLFLLCISSSVEAGAGKGRSGRTSIIGTIGDVSIVGGVNEASIRVAGTFTICFTGLKDECYSKQNKIGLYIVVNLPTRNQFRLDFPKCHITQFPKANDQTNLIYLILCL